MLTAQSGEVVNGFGGNDTLVTAEDSDGATINGNAGNDTLELNGTNATANGGIGNDTIDSRYILNGVAEGGEGDDEITFYPLRPSDALDGTETEDTSSANGGAGDDQTLCRVPLIWSKVAMAMTSSTIPPQAGQLSATLAMIP